MTLLKLLPLFLKMCVFSQQRSLLYMNRPLLKGLTVERLRWCLLFIFLECFKKAVYLTSLNLQSVPVVDTSENQKETCLCGTQKGHHWSLTGITKTQQLCLWAPDSFWPFFHSLFFCPSPWAPSPFYVFMSCLGLSVTTHDITSIVDLSALSRSLVALCSRRTVVADTWLCHGQLFAVRYKTHIHLHLLCLWPVGGWFDIGRWQLRLTL